MSVCPCVRCLYDGLSSIFRPLNSLARQFLTKKYGRDSCSCTYVLQLYPGVDSLNVSFLTTQPYYSYLISQYINIEFDQCTIFISSRCVFLCNCFRFDNMKLRMSNFRSHVFVYNKSYQLKHQVLRSFNLARYTSLRIR